MTDIEKMVCALDLMIQKNELIVRSLDVKYPQCKWELTDSCVARRCINIHKMFVTVRYLLNYNYDDCSINALLRVIADHISSLLLIYAAPTKEEALLRQYLYLADGVSERIKTLKSSERGKQYANFQSLNQEYNTYIQCVKINPLYAEHKQIIDGFIKHNNWKFKSLTGKESYSWPDLYKEKLNIPIDYISYLSQFVHGLAGSTYCYNGAISTSTMIALTTCLCSRYSYYLWDVVKSYPSKMEMDYLNSMTTFDNEIVKLKKPND